MDAAVAVAAGRPSPLSPRVEYSPFVRAGDETEISRVVEAELQQLEARKGRGLLNTPDLQVISVVMYPSTSIYGDTNVDI